LLTREQLLPARFGEKYQRIAFESAPLVEQRHGDAPYRTAMNFHADADHHATLMDRDTAVVGGGIDHQEKVQGRS